MLSNLLRFLIVAIGIFTAFSFDLKAKPIKNLPQESSYHLKLDKDSSQTADTIKKDKANKLNTLNLSADNFPKGKQISPIQLVKGKIPGLVITTESGPSGGNSDFNYRGGSSLFFNETPLVIIDGFIIDNQKIEGMRSPFNLLHSNDIEQITFLKDGPESAIYGGRASNGVILIDTRKEEMKRPLQVSYEGQVSYSDISEMYNVYSASEFRSIIEKRYAGQDEVLQLLGEANTNWQDAIYKNQFNTDHHLRLYGNLNKKNIPYQITYGLTKNQGILETSSLERNTIGVQTFPSFFEDKLELGLNLKSMFTKNRFAEWDATHSALQFNPTQPIYDEGNSLGGYYTPDGFSEDPLSTMYQNPLALLNLTEERWGIDRYFANFHLKYNFHFLPDLSVKLNYGFDNTDSNGGTKIPGEAAWEGENGSNNYYKISYKNKLLHSTIRYNKQIKPVKSRFDLLVGMSRQEFSKSYNFSYTNYEETERFDQYSYNTERLMTSSFGKLNYTYDNRFLLDISIRQDESSIHTEKEKMQLFPALGISWNMHNELFVKKADFVSWLKLYGSYSETSNITFSQKNYSAVDLELVYPVTKSKNIGLEYGLLDNKIIGTLNIYERVTSNPFVIKPIPSGEGFTNLLLTNEGKIINKGFEATLNTQIITKKDFSWKLSSNFALNNNKINGLYEESESTGYATGYIRGGVGNTIQIMQNGNPERSFYTYQQIYNEEGIPLEGFYVDQNGDGDIYQDDKKTYKKPAPTKTFGFSTSLKYKEIDFEIAGRARTGNYVYNNIASVHTPYSEMYSTVGYLRNRTNQGLYHFDNPQYYSDYYVEDGSFLKIDYISMGYTFNFSENNKTSIRIYSTIQNPLLFTNYSGLDPEVNDGIDYNAYPRTTTYILGVSMNL